MKDRVIELVGIFCQGRTDIFLIDLAISTSGHMRLVIDGDEGVSVQDCVDLSRCIERDFNQNECEFSLEVTSAGLLESLKTKRQYVKNINRNMEVETLDGKKYFGKLIAVSDTDMTLEFKVREPKKIGKGKQTVVKQSKMDYDQITKANIKVAFK